MKQKIHFQKTTDIDQNFSKAYYHLAKSLRNPSEFDQAFRNYETALEIDPGMEECHYNFACLLIEGEKLKNDGTLVKEPNLTLAEKHLKLAIEVNPRNFLKLTIKLAKYRIPKRNILRH